MQSARLEMILPTVSPHSWRTCGYVGGGLKVSAHRVIYRLDIVSAWIVSHAVLFLGLVSGTRNQTGGWEAWRATG